MAEHRRSIRWRRLGTALLVVLGAVASACGSSGSGTTATTVSTAPAGPVVTIEPATGLTVGQDVVVSGTGFPAGAGVLLGQCAGGGRDQATCDQSTRSIATTDPGGAFTATYEVRGTIGVASGLVDCSAAGACDLVAGVADMRPNLVSVPLQVAAEAPAFAAPSCPGPYPPVGVFRGAVGVPSLPPHVTGTPRPYADARAAVSIARDGDDLVLSVGYLGSARTFTTAPHGAGGNEDRTPGPSDTPYGLVSIVTADDGAVYVTLEQNSSGDYARFGWRFDDPCAP